MWKSCTFIPGKRSIFAIQEPDSDEAAEDCNEEENLTNIKVQSHVKRTENSDFLEREDCMRNQSGLKLDCKKDGVQRSRFCELGCKLRESADEWSEDKAEVLKKRNQEETIDNCENFGTESCFCSRCTYEVGDFIFEDDKTQVKLVDSSDEDFGTHSGSLDDDHRQSWDNESDVKQCYFTFKLTTSGLLDYEPISGGRPRVVSSDVLARPNGGETGGETGAKKKLMSTKITRKGRGNVKLISFKTYHNNIDVGMILLSQEHFVWNFPGLWQALCQREDGTMQCLFCSK